MCFIFAFLRRFSLLLVIKKKIIKQAKINATKKIKEYVNPRCLMDKYIAIETIKLVRPDKIEAFL